MGFIKTVIGDADKQAGACDSADDAEACHTGVANKIKQDFLRGKPAMVKCLRKAGIKISKKGLAAIEDSLIQNTQTVVLNAFKKNPVETADGSAEKAEPKAEEPTTTNDESTSVTNESAPVAVAAPLAIDDAPKEAPKPAEEQPQPSSIDESAKPIEVAPKDETKPADNAQFSAVADTPVAAAVDTPTPTPIVVDSAPSAVVDTAPAAIVDTPPSPAVDTSTPVVDA